MSETGSEPVVLRFEPSPKRVRVVFGGEMVADSTGVHLLYENGRLPVYYFPRDDLRMDLAEASGHRTNCPHKGEATYWHLTAAGRRAENALWSYQVPIPGAAAIKDYAAFYWDKMDHWYEEDEEVFVHPRDPYVRIDILDSSRPVQVLVGGQIVAESSRARFLFETGLPTRYYIPPEDLRRDLLESSNSVTACPYKGTARYHSARIEGRLYPDIVWHYPDPLPESARIKGYHAFFDETVDAILVDGKEQPRPKTKWS